MKKSRDSVGRDRDDSNDTGPVITSESTKRILDLIACGERQHVAFVWTSRLG